MIRAFVAADLPEAVKQKLEETARQLEQLGLDGRVARIEGLHLTLKFLGHVAENQLQSIRDALEKSRPGIGPFDLTIRGIGVFPHAARPRVVWAGVDRNEPLEQLQTRIEGNLDKLGFPAEKRPYRPHLTLMRLKSTRRLKELLLFLREHRQDDPLSFLVDAYHLYQSTLKPTGAEYRRLASFPL